jgi:hypothetical protein
MDVKSKHAWWRCRKVYAMHSLECETPPVVRLYLMFCLTTAL